MIALYVVLPLALLIAGGAVAAFVWSVSAGQLDDLDTPPRRLLFDDVAPARPPIGAPPVSATTRRPPPPARSRAR